jgi:hypothetical protein
MVEITDVPLKHRLRSTRLHGTTSQKTIFISHQLKSHVKIVLISIFALWATQPMQMELNLDTIKNDTWHAVA